LALCTRILIALVNGFLQPSFVQPSYSVCTCTGAVKTLILGRSKASYNKALLYGDAIYSYIYLRPPSPDRYVLRYRHVTTCLVGAVGQISFLSELPDMQIFNKLNALAFLSLNCFPPQGVYCFHIEEYTSFGVVSDTFPGSKIVLPNAG
jgi:hypothetical protein